mmetsp:Transcript_35451/g.56957  ORF Transcript_35451/g.56957 Transcript_35451/m.56957 type:complete len:443 (-) Transcript_35451:140-1468(-)
MSEYIVDLESKFRDRKLRRSKRRSGNKTDIGGSSSSAMNIHVNSKNKDNPSMLTRRRTSKTMSKTKSKSGNKRSALADISNKQTFVGGKSKVPRTTRKQSEVKSAIQEDVNNENPEDFGMISDSSCGEDNNRSPISMDTLHDELDDYDDSSSVAGFSDTSDEMVVERTLQGQGLLAKIQSSKPDPSYSYESDIVNFLLEREEKYMEDGNKMTAVQEDINHTMRSILVDWLVEVADEYKLHRQTFFLTVNYIDRVLSDISINRTKLQLVGVSAMLLASKYEEIYPPSVDEFVYISDNTYTRDEVIRMESLILKSLKFRLTAPTPEEFLKIYNKLIQLKEKELQLAKYLIELSAQEPMYVAYPPSRIAAAAVLLSRYTISGESEMPTALRYCSKACFNDLKEVLIDLYKAHKKHYNGDTTLKAVSTKYSSKQCMRVALIVPRKM